MGRRLTLASALAATALACGCGSPGTAGPVLEYDACQPLVLVTESGVTDAQAAGIAAGIALWNSAAGTRLTVAAAAPEMPAASVPIRFQPAAPPFHGLYDGGEIFINDDLSADPEAIVIAHEVGHAFGLVHVATSERTSVMNPGNMTTEPTPSDVAILAARWGSCP